ncbi:hypothetical protein [Bradyrhizobium sp. LB11.1]|uniref:hypothetical protein n=1 Tax=Bradyrhizobium sp. LB11.1 TaxID=3156326 RepID=UPI003397C734
MVRIAGLRSLVISIEITPDTANRFVRRSFRLLTHGWDSQSRELKIWSDTARELSASGCALEVNGKLKAAFAIRDGAAARSCEHFLNASGFDAQTKVREGVPVPELSLPGFSFGRVRQVPHRAYMNGALSTHQ